MPELIAVEVILRVGEIDASLVKEGELVTVEAGMRPVGVREW
jgi:hypothetical protein